MMNGTVLVLGPSGRFGRHAIGAFEASGWSVRAFNRQTEDLGTAAQGADVIVNAWNAPYTDWARLLPSLHDDVIRTARDVGATVMVPGNTYVFGPSTPSPWSETSPHRAENVLGRARIAMENAYRMSSVRTIIVRAGDFIDTEPSSNWFDRILTPKIDKGILTYPGNPDAPHAWAYLPDLARATVALAEMREDLPEFADIPFPGYTMTGNELAAASARAIGRPVRLKRMSWLPIRLLQPFWPMARHLIEMRYLWDTPHRLDDTRFRELLPEFQSTPPDAALATALGRTLIKS